MDIRIFPDKQALASAAADRAAAIIRNSITQGGHARIIAATGASQFELLKALTSLPEIDWSRVEMFHLDEYVGIPDTHPASFCKYLRERLIDKAGIGKYHLLNGVGDPATVIAEVGQELQRAPIDVAFVGVGENGHLAFNDPPADFDTEEPYAVVSLDEACRSQQLNEGWFSSLEDVPKRAISMTIRQILKANRILCIVPDARKARAVKNCFEGGVSPMAPASALQNHAATIVYLDPLSSSLLSSDVRVERV
ncbi:MAG TPA: glucosamine-6-phosphate deaminase [Candidatus Acidoferrum sp.]|jgi:glucosamine-6-phosphate deaminase|nr:glucosamine-6-phosphate deaminase [Candidatus Acidoferrum sp.]